MKIVRLSIQNFRGIKNAEILFHDHVVLVGDNNTGKSTVLEAIDLVLGPERMHRSPPIDEHDFYVGEYLGAEENPISINIEVVVTDLSEEQSRHFGAHIEWWDANETKLLSAPPPEQTENPNVTLALRLGFEGIYDSDEDSFIGKTFFLSPQREDGGKDPFSTRDKRLCGFLFLRTLRTGSRALSLERGSLLDVILRLHDLRPKMWEDILDKLRTLPVAEEDELGVKSILENVQNAVQKFVPMEWAEKPHIKVSDLTREHLRKTLTVFMGTGEKTSAGTEYVAPFNHQGTGTINTLVLALLSMIANLKQNVIFAMEEPEIAIPPHTQKRIVESIKSMAAQAFFTSHSPYVLGEFAPEHLIILKRENGILESIPATLPPAVKAKEYRAELSVRFCECLLARRVLIVEGQTEYDALPTAGRRLHELDANRFKTLESIGIAVINARSDSQIIPLNDYFTNLGKAVFAIYDHQEDEVSNAISSTVEKSYESPKKSFERLLLDHTSENALRRFAREIIDEGRWPPHLSSEEPSTETPLRNLKTALRKFLKNKKGSGGAAQLLTLCEIDEMPEFIVTTMEDILNTVGCVSESSTEQDIR